MRQNLRALRDTGLLREHGEQLFSERSKATTIYTTGYICAVLGISIDAVFGIENKSSTPEEAEFVRQLAELKVEARFHEQTISYLEKTVAEKDTRLEQAHAALEHYRKESDDNRKKVQPWVFIATLVLFALAIAFTCVYLLIFDVGNPHYGLFQQKLASAANFPGCGEIVDKLKLYL